MEKVKKFFSTNLHYIIFFVVFMIILFGIVINNPIKQTDELTLFGETKKMTEGLYIYKDINVLVTPLFFYFGYFLLKIFGSNYLIYRIYGVIIWLFLYLNIYKLFVEMKISKIHSYIYLILFSLFMKDVIIVSANYNILAVAFCILSNRYYLKYYKNKTKRFYLIQGILFFLIFMIKQTIGIYQFLCFIICEFLIDRKTIKEYLKNFLVYLVPAILGFLVYCIYLFKLNSLYDFINYTFLGMVDFKNNGIVESYIIFLALINIILYIYSWRKNIINNNQKIVFIQSIIMLLIAYPILCGFHSKIALIFTFISFICLVDKKNTKSIIDYIIFTLLFSIIIFITMKNIINWKNKYITKKETPYFGAVYNSYMENRIDNVENYIKNSDKKVVIVSPESYLYNLELGINNGILDLPVKGNVGINGEKKIIQTLNELEDVKIVITKYKYFQEYDNIHKYIRDNYKLIDVFNEVYEVYEK